MHYPTFLFLMMVSTLLVGCSNHDDTVLSVSADGSGDMQLRPPPLLINSRMIGQESLFAEVSISYSGVSTSFTAEKEANKDHWTAQLQVPTQTAFTISITWFDRLDQQRLDLVTASNSFQPINFAGEITINRNFSNFDSDNFDADSDFVVNLTERLNGTSPFDASSPTSSPSSLPTSLPSNELTSNSTEFRHIRCIESYPKGACEGIQSQVNQQSINGITQSVSIHSNGSCDSLVPEPRVRFLEEDGYPYPQGSESTIFNTIHDFTGYRYSVGDLVSCLIVHSNSD